MRLVSPAVPEPVLAIARVLASTGRSAHLAGECLVDLLSDRPRRSYTLLTSASAGEIAGLFAAAVVTAPHAAAWQLPTPAGPLDLLPIGDGAEALEAALHARALRFAAIAYEPLRRERVDPFAGAADLERGVLRTIGAAEPWLREQPGLALAVARVVAERGLAPDDELERALARLGPADLEREPAALRGQALRRLLDAKHAGDALALLARTGLERALGVTMRADTPALLACAPADPALRLAIWLRGQRPGRFLRRHRVHPALGERVIRLLASHPVEQQFSPRRRSALDRLARLSQEDRDALFWLRRHELGGAGAGAGASASASDASAVEALAAALADHLAALAAEAETSKTPALALDGRAVMEILGLAPGPEVGAALDVLRDEVARRPERNDPEQLRELLLRWWSTSRAGKLDARGRPLA